MTHGQVKALWQELNVLVKYIIDNKINNTYLNYGLKKNARILEKADKAIEDSISEELKAIEAKAFEAGSKALALLSDEERPKVNAFMLGLAELTEEEQARQKELLADYFTFLEKEDDIKLYLLDFEEIKNVPLEWAYSNILENFIKE